MQLLVRHWVGKLLKWFGIIWNLVILWNAARGIYNLSHSQYTLSFISIGTNSERIVRKHAQPWHFSYISIFCLNYAIHHNVPMNASHIESNKYAAHSIGSYHVNIWKSEYQRNRMKTFDLKKKKRKSNSMANWIC